MFIQVLIVVIFIIEAFVELVEMHKKMIQEGKYEYKPALAFVLGLGAMFLFKGLNIFEYLEVEINLSGLWHQFASGILLGVLLARYSGQLNSILDVLDGLKQRLRPADN